MINSLLNKIRLDDREGELDAPATTNARREVIANKPFLKRLYQDWYKRVTEGLSITGDEKVLEIGSGAGFIKEQYANIITSDIMPLAQCDMVVAAEELPFADCELSAIIMVDVFHHIPEAGRFLSEAQRVLKPGGKIKMVEPASTWFGRIIYRGWHHEPYDAETSAWSFPSTGPLSGANIALPWMVFQRDRDIFHSNYPSLKINKISYHTPFSYILSGGFSFKSLLPGWAFGIATLIEAILTPLYPILAMFHTIEVVKTESKRDEEQ